MESSIAVFLKRRLACELPPTEAVRGSAHMQQRHLHCAHHARGHTPHRHHHPPAHPRGAHGLRRARPTRCDFDCRQAGGLLATVRQTYLASVGRRSSSSLS